MVTNRYTSGNGTSAQSGMVTGRVKEGFLPFINRLDIRGQILSGYFIIIALMILISIVLLVNLRSLVSDFDFLVDHDLVVLQQASDLQRLMVDGETGMRGYLLTGNTEFLEPFYNAHGQITSNGTAVSGGQFDVLYRDLYELVSDNPDQQAALTEIMDARNDWVNDVALPFIRSRQEVAAGSVTFSAISDFVASGAGKALMDQMRAEIDQIVTDLNTSAEPNRVAIQVATHVMSDMVDKETGLRGYLLVGDSAFLEPYNVATVSLADDLRQLESVLRSDAANRERLANFTALSQRWTNEIAEPLIAQRNELNRYDVNMDDVIAFVESGIGKQYMDGIRVQIDSWVAEEVRLNNFRADAANTLADNLQMTVLGLAAFTILIGVGLGWYIGNQISDNTRTVLNAAQQVTAGDLDQRLEATANDETGQLAHAFNDMVESLRVTMSSQVAKESIEGVISEYNAFVREVADGKLSTRLDMQGNGYQANEDLLQLGDNLNNMVENLAEMAFQVRDAATAVASTVAEIQAASTQQTASATEQDAAVTQTVATLEEVRQTVQQTSEIARNVADASQESVTISGQGQAAVVRSVDGMKVIRERVEGIAETILALSERTQQIGEIIDTVNALADQSKLLALNASIEAARAGDEGKGFAVVAMEVRQLAEQSREATARVRDILSEIQQATNTAVMVTEEGNKGVESGMVLVNSAGEAIQQLSSTLDLAAQSAAQIAASASQQSNGMDQLSSAMMQIKQASSQTAASVRQTEESTRNLLDMSRRLDEAAKRYDL